MNSNFNQLKLTTYIKLLYRSNQSLFKVKLALDTNFIFVLSTIPDLL